ncbi:hypothetical protein B0T19DRAFT_457681 [Cercophora scortea]|uniref:Uncharacterized protein n=1 Tax=Cercophora scortea TaxID=314031 RepID=A0AAE0IX23_9PEZI|nr:hypothetical protein B0T19DRAFT_457681 [Cercophora scortea]
MPPKRTYVVESDDSLCKESEASASNPQPRLSSEAPAESGSKSLLPGSRKRRSPALAEDDADDEDEDEDDDDLPLIPRLAQRLRSSRRPAKPVSAPSQKPPPPPPSHSVTPPPMQRFYGPYNPKYDIDGEETPVEHIYKHTVHAVPAAVADRMLGIVRPPQRKIYNPIATGPELMKEGNEENGLIDDHDTYPPNFKFKQEDEQPLKTVEEEGKDQDYELDEANVKNVAKAILEQLGQYPHGDIAYSTSLVGAPSPSIQMNLSTGIGSINTPPTDDDFARLIDFAKAVRTKELGPGFRRLPMNPTLFISAKYFSSNSQEWDRYLSQQALRAGEALGFGGIHLVARPFGLFLASKSSPWRYMRNPSQYRGPKHVGTLAVILNMGYEGGEFAFGLNNRDLFVETADKEAKHGQMALVAYHDTVNLDCYPLTKGMRLSLAYDLFMPNYRGSQPRDWVQYVLDPAEKLDLNIWSINKIWAARVKEGQMDNFPFVLVLNDTQHQNLDLTSLSVESRSWVEAMRRATWRPIDGYQLSIYIVAVTATSKNYENTVKRTKYSIDRAVDLDGVLQPEIKNIVIEEGGVVQPEGFGDGVVRRTVTAAMNTTTRTRTCILLKLDKL